MANEQPPYAQLSAQRPLFATHVVDSRARKFGVQVPALSFLSSGKAAKRSSGTDGHQKCQLGHVSGRAKSIKGRLLEKRRTAVARSLATRQRGRIQHLCRWYWKRANDTSRLAYSQHPPDGPTLGKTSLSFLARETISAISKFQYPVGQGQTSSTPIC